MSLPRIVCIVLLPTSNSYWAVIVLVLNFNNPK